MYLPEAIGRFAESSLANWSAKDGCEKLTSDPVALVYVKHRQRLAIGQNRYVTCETVGTFAEASSADWSAKERCGKLTSDSSAIAYVKYR
jgi:hypothetical protein